MLQLSVADIFWIIPHTQLTSHNSTYYVIIAQLGYYMKSMSDPVTMFLDQSMCSLALKGADLSPFNLYTLDSCASWPITSQAKQSAQAVR